MVTSVLFLLAAAVPLDRDGVNDVAIEEITDGLVLAASSALHTGPSYAKAKDADSAATRKAFVPMCAGKLGDIAEQWKETTRHPELTLGHSLATHMQVQCTQGLPLKEPSCDKLAAQLQVTLDAGMPFYAPTNDTNATNASDAKASLVSIRRVLPDAQEKTDLVQRTGAENGDPANATALQSVEEWCGVFFDAFFEAIVKEAEESKGEEAKEEAALVHGTAKHHRATDAWEPMRALVMRKVRAVQALARKLGKNASAPVYGAELIKAEAKAQEAKAAVYAAGGDADAAKTKEAFVPECVAALEATAETYLGNGLHGATRTLGLSMATHLQVQCHDGMPIAEEACDDLASQLLKLLDHGNPIVAPTEAPTANATNGTNATEGEDKAAPEEAALVVRRVLARVGRNDTNGSTDGPQVLAHGEEWCGLFFDDFLAGVIAEPDFYAQAKEGEGEGEGEEAKEEKKEFLQRK